MAWEEKLRGFVRCFDENGAAVWPYARDWIRYARQALVEIDRLRTTVESLNIALKDKDGDLGSAYADVRELRKELEEAQQYREAYLANGEAYQRQLAELRKELEETRARLVARETELDRDLADRVYADTIGKTALADLTGRLRAQDQQLARLEAASYCHPLCEANRCRGCGARDHHFRGCSVSAQYTIVISSEHGTCNCNREENLRKAKDDDGKA